MPHPSRCHRSSPPREPAPPSPVTSAEAALEVVRLAASPSQPCVVALPLDGDRRGSVVWCVDGTTRPDDVLHVAQLVLGTAGPPAATAALVLASGRPGRPLVAPDDGDWWRWSLLVQACEERGVVLLDWFLLGGGTAVSMGELDDQPDERWAPG